MSEDRLSVLLDQFYTKRTVALDLFSKFNAIVLLNGFKNNDWLEPSAGGGAFYDLMPKNKLGLDLDVKISNVIQADFLTYDLPKNDYIVLGNPPFGKNSSLAVKFFNKAALNAVMIGFVVPKTFKKDGLKNKLNRRFHLIYEEDLQKNSFELDGKSYHVPCVFQVWIKREDLREVVKREFIHDDFSFVSKEKGDFAIQRVGMAAGRVKIDFEKYAVASHYFIKANEDVRKVFENIDWSSVKGNTAGNPSISKSELIKLYEQNK